MKFSARPFFALCALFCFNFVQAQISFPTPAPSDERSGLHAFTNAVLYVDYKTRIEGATLLVRDGKVVASGLNVGIPADAVKHDCTGKTIYPSFIDLYAAGYGLPPLPESARGQGGGGFGAPRPPENKRGATAWNEALRPEYNAVSNFQNDAKSAEEWRKIGFGVLLSHRADGISRGTGVLTALSDLREHENIVQEKAAHALSFRKGSSTTAYPVSLMGCISLLRQTYLDAQWYKSEGYKTEKNLSLEAWNTVQNLPQIFEAGDKLDLLRIHRLGLEFGMKYIVRGGGDEYQRLKEIAATGMPLILPLNFPEGYDVRDPYDALNVSLKELKHWEMAPSNPSRVQSAGIPFALTTDGLKDRSRFMENLRKSIEFGLSEEDALKALTWSPANFVNVYDRIGSLEPGKWANFIIATGNIFKTETKITENWVKGRAYDVAADKSLPTSVTGSWKLRVGAEQYVLTLKNKGDTPEAQVMKQDSSKVKADFSYMPNGVVSLNFQPDSAKKAVVSLSGVLSGREMRGTGVLVDGRWADWNAAYSNPAGPDKPVKQNPVTTPAIGEVIYPFTAFGRNEIPSRQNFLVQNATVWTNERDGIMKNAGVLVQNGKIAKIGRKLSATENAVIIDGTGKHLTAGIIDEHSHIAATRGINEGTQESSAEVRIGDIIDSEDIDIYRQLAGGVTSSHILHGSSNPIGGQTQLIKLRWGYSPEALKFENWPGYIKFALGENVKQSNGNFNTNRYPQTRMGVEQVYVDYFTRAREYARLKASGKPYRRDLELDALQEILESKRFITCHSYVQSEITMMIRVAERFGFKLNTFTHILEGYKVADKMAKHGAGGSSFADWWAYKYEVYEAIPYNPKMMADRGVVVAINSDDAEMARRLNQEAAKSVAYGGMKEEDAWKMVTLNPAKLLRVDDRTGSVRSGKDADLVLWSDHPLSVYAKAEKTWVDGILFFDRKTDEQLQLQVEQERNRIIQKLQTEKKDGPGGARPRGPKGHYHCDDEEDEGN